MNSSNLLSIILLSYYSKDRIYEVFKCVSEKMDIENIPYELIIIDDGSKDNSYEVALELEDKEERVKAYQLTKNYTSHYARFAGFYVAKGACATSIPDDLQLPLDVVVRMYRLWEKGQKVIVPFRASRNDGWLKDKFSNGYYNIMNAISEIKFPKGGADGCLIDREIIDILNEKIHPINTSTIVEVLRLGFDPVFIPFDRPPKTGKSRWTKKKKITLALDTILASSSFPIKLISFLGIFTMFVSFIFIVISTLIKITGENSFLGFGISGWTSNFILISLFSGLTLFSLGIIAEYIWRIHEEVKDRPGYIIKKKENKNKLT